MRSDFDYMLVFIIIYILFILGIALLTHIFHALGLMVIARRRNLAWPGLAWLPVIGICYLTGSIADQYDRQEIGTDHNLRSWLLGLSTALTALQPILMILLISSRGFEQSAPPPIFFIVMLIMLVAGVPFTILLYLSLYKLFKSCQPANATAFLLLSIFLSITPFLVFAVRKYDDGQPA